MADRVLVTGMSGFIGSHVAARLLEKGYIVRGAVRNPGKAEAVRSRIAAHVKVAPESIELVEADLGYDDGWADAVKDCRYIQHIASPLPIDPPSEREALVPEARAGAQRVLENGLSSGAERIVMTSSIAAMIGQPGRKKHMTFGETDWSDPDWKPLPAYPVSKTRAELSAWAYVEAQKMKERLAVVNPALVFGPDTFENAGASLQVIIALMKGDFPRAPKIAIPVVDVRDVAAIHVAAMTAPDAGGRRLIAASNTLSFLEIAGVLRSAYPQVRKLPKGEMPNFILHIFARFDERVKTILSDLGTHHEADAAYVTNLTQVIPRPAKEAILSAAASLIENGTIRLED